ncbi:hypothetical protein AVEN_136438-1 [Araneus ventricosus]|uniref:CCHC-type domain-containing protein n=1 Tax=Araneus ventricosus TaxID=182803 RepID=A0A4Y2JG98_ARAVE|nr:hypothetical protein AVEN_136438-1 [Araneus ventricosus]
MRTKYIKCGEEHATREFSIKNTIEVPKCVNCGETGHLAAFKDCKALPTIPRTITRQPRKTSAQAGKKTPQQEENTSEVMPELTYLKDSLGAPRDVRES